MNFKAGFASLNIDPPLGIGVAGYYIPRFAKGILDSVEVGALVLELDGKKIAIVSIDSCGIPTAQIANYAELAEKRTGIKKENFLIASTHTHTAPLAYKTSSFEADEKPIIEYAKFLGERICEAVKLAVEDLGEAKMGYAVGYAPEKVSYIRRYKMKDGSVMTCPPIDDENILHPIGELDKRVNLLRFDRVGKESIALVNYGLHADTTNGELISADWPGVMRRTLKKALDGTHCIFLNGAEGDVGSTNVHPQAEDMNDTEISFDNEMKSPGMARFVGRAMAGCVLEIYDRVKYTDINEIELIKRRITVDANLASEEELKLAREYKKLHEAGRDDLIPYTAMQLTTVVAEAIRMCKMANGPKNFEFTLSGLKIGGAAIVGIPGEPFTEIGVKIKEATGWDIILPCALANGSEGYFPIKSAYEEGGYEARTSRYKAGTAEKIISEAHALLSDLKNA